MKRQKPGSSPCHEQPLQLRADLQCHQSCPYLLSHKLRLQASEDMCASASLSFHLPHRQANEEVARSFVQFAVVNASRFLHGCRSQ